MKNQRDIYVFIKDDFGKFQRATQLPNGDYLVSANAQPYPLKFNPSNLLSTDIEFATNNAYFSLARTISNTFVFIEDGAAILRKFYYQKSGVNNFLYMIMVQWNGSTNQYELAYSGRIAFSVKSDNPIKNTFTVSIVDDTAWGWIQQNDSVEYAIECNKTNPDAIKVLFDGLTLVNKYTYQTVQAPIFSYADGNGLGQFKTMPFVLVNQDGDSSGIFAQSQESYPISLSGTGGWHFVDQTVPGFFFLSRYGGNVRITGQIMFEWASDYTQSGGGSIMILSNQKTYPVTGSFAFGNVIADFSKGNLIHGKTYKYDFDFTFNLNPDERLFLIVCLNDNNANRFNITPIVTNNYATTNTTPQPQVAYGLRASDLLKQLSAKATNNRFSVLSDLLSSSNMVLLSGDSLRNVEDAKIYTNYFDFFSTISSIFWAAHKNQNGALSIEKATRIYGKNTKNVTNLKWTVEPGDTTGYGFGSTSFFNTAVFTFDAVTDPNVVTVKVLTRKKGSYQIFESVASSTTARILVYSRFPNEISFASYDKNGFMIDQTAWVDLSGAENSVPTDPIFLYSPKIVDLGEVIDMNLIPANDYYYNQVVVGSPKQDYRHPSGRLEFNSENTFSLDLITVKNTLNIVSKYRLGCFDITFLLLDYQGGSTTDNTGDKSVYAVEISNDKGSATQNIETFENVTIDNSLLEPVIKFPLNNDTITFNKPFLRGIGIPGKTVNVYVDGVLDGSALIAADYTWTYQLVTALTAYQSGVYTGLHTIDVSYGTELDPKSTISVLIDTSFVQETQVIYPQENDNLYNNLPFIRGVAQPSKSFNVVIDGVSIGNVTADNSGRWFIYPAVPITNGDHVLTADGKTVNFNVNSFVEYPLLTYVGSELDGWPVINNLPLIKGVAEPGTKVELWLNYVTYTSIGSTFADNNGNWSFQTIGVNYNDPLSNTSVILVPVKNGLNVFSTSLINNTVKIGVSGYKLNRPNFSSITGVTDNTVFNTSYSPKRMLMNHAGLFAAIGKKLNVQKIDKNAAFSTTLNGVTISENTSVDVNELGDPLMMLEYAEIKVKAYGTFAKTLYDFNSGDLIRFTKNGLELFALPIGSMKINNITSQVQTWKLLLAPETTYVTLLNLYKQGITINIMKNSIYHSDYNTLHFVKYNYSIAQKYNFSEIYDDIFSNRNSAWVDNPTYIQKMQTTETGIIDQLVSNGVANITLQVYDCKTGNKIGTLNYNTVNPSPVAAPLVVNQCTIDFSIYSGIIYFVLCVGGTPIMISERIWVKPSWPNTILIESSNSLNIIGAYFSTGFSSVIRVEGLVKKWQPNVTSFVADEENGDSEMLHSIISRKRTIRFGTAFGLPDYLGAIKVPLALGLDNLNIEGVAYTLDKDEKITPSDDLEGHPLYYYNVNLDIKYNESGNVFDASAATGGTSDGAVVLNVDGSAFGLPPGQVQTIELANE